MEKPCSEQSWRLEGSEACGQTPRLLIPCADTTVLLKHVRAKKSSGFRNRILGQVVPKTPVWISAQEPYYSRKTADKCWTCWDLLENYKGEFKNQTREQLIAKGYTMVLIYNYLKGLKWMKRFMAWNEVSQNLKCSCVWTSIWRGKQVKECKIIVW